MKSETKRTSPDALDGLKRRLSGIKQMEVAIGFPSGKQNAYPDGTPVLDVAVSHVFGEGVPQRDFMTAAKPGLIKAVEPIVQAIVHMVNTGQGSQPKIEALENAIGQVGQAEVQLAITDGNWTPNSDNPMPEWLRARLSQNLGVDIPDGMSYREAKMRFKGSDKPLIFDGHMVGSVTYVVRERSE